MSQTLNVKVKNTDRNVTVNFPLEVGENTEENISIYGEDVVNNYFVAQLKVAAQNAARLRLGELNTDEEGNDVKGSYAHSTDSVVEWVANEWTPTVRRRETDPRKKLQTVAETLGLSNEDLVAMLQELSNSKHSNGDDSDED